MVWRLREGEMWWQSAAREKDDMNVSISFLPDDIFPSAGNYYRIICASSRISCLGRNRSFRSLSILLIHQLREWSTPKLYKLEDTMAHTLDYMVESIGNMYMYEAALLRADISATDNSRNVIYLSLTLLHILVKGLFRAELPRSHVYLYRQRGS